MSAPTPPRLLVVDDDPGILPILERLARRLGFDVQYESSGRAAIDKLGELMPDVALVDLQMPELNGIDVLKGMRAEDPDCQVILMTGNATVDTAIEAVKSGALDYLNKPFDFERLEALLVGVRDGLSQRERLLKVDADFATQIEFHGMIGRSLAMQDLFSAIRRLAPHAQRILVTGETGTGKELVARALHASGPRRARRFLTVNCSAVVDTLFESELFGHVRGAFTGATDTKVGMFEHAHQGTLFLDEAGELPMSLQPKLLRAVEYGEIQRVGSLETKQVDVHVIAATNRDLRAEVDAGRFRSDLFYRLSIVEIHLPPLRDRREDIPYLTAAFLREMGTRLDRAITGVSPGAERLLQEADWPGNIRQLRNVLGRACIFAEGGFLSEPDIQAALAVPAPAGGTAPPSAQAADAGPGAAGGPDVSSDLLTTAEREQIRRVLADTGGNKAEAAKRLGVSRRSLYRWLKRLDLGL
ncbi:MAG TPA: sigma-54 dependent transcriptional regulator [Vicinamibacterales bacterium]|nr:sigma-54 dependent transcriptional regulator [Vicinamibacterales bacterium]